MRRAGRRARWYSHMYNIDDTYHDHIRKLSSIRTKAFTKAWAYPYNAETTRGPRTFLSPLHTAVQKSSV